MSLSPSPPPVRSPATAPHPGITGRTWVVTGAARGLGLELVRHLAGRGARVVALARSGGPLDGMRNVSHMPCDLDDPGGFDRIARGLGGIRIDVVVHAAGVRGDTGGLATFSAEDLAGVMRVNVAGPLLLTRTLIPRLAPDATLAFVSSRAGSCAEGADPDGDYAYCMSKAALNRAVAKLADDCPWRVLAIHPGWLRTDMGGRGAPDEAGPAAAHLCDLIAARDGPRSGSFTDRFGRPIGW